MLLREVIVALTPAESAIQSVRRAGNDLFRRLKNLKTKANFNNLPGILHICSSIDFWLFQNSELCLPRKRITSNDKMKEMKLEEEEDRGKQLKQNKQGGHSRNF